MVVSLYIGLGIGGLITGLMIGASASPVIGAALPALVSVIVSVLAVVIQNPLDPKIADLIKQENLTRQQTKELKSLRTERNRLPARLGLILTIFFGLYAVGLVVGTTARIKNWFIADEHASETLTKLATDASTREEAIKRIRLFESLRTYGFSEGDSAEIASKPPDKWTDELKPREHPPVVGHILIPY